MNQLSLESAGSCGFLTPKDRGRGYIARGEESAENQLIWELLQTRNIDSAFTSCGCRSKLWKKAAFHIDQQSRQEHNHTSCIQGDKTPPRSHKSQWETQSSHSWQQSSALAAKKKRQPRSTKGCWGRLQGDPSAASQNLRGTTFLAGCPVATEQRVMGLN